MTYILHEFLFKRSLLYMFLNDRWTTVILNNGYFESLSENFYFHFRGF